MNQARINMSSKTLFTACKDFVVRAMLDHRASHGRISPDKTSLEKCITWQHVKKLSELCRFKYLYSSINETLNTAAVLFARQCNAIAAQKVRRAVQIVNLYHKLGYDRQTVQNVVEKLGRSFLRNRKDQSLYFMFGAAMFSWQMEKFSKEDIDDCVHEIQSLPGQCQKELPRNSLGIGWEKVIDRPHLVVWRNPIPDSYLYEYKVFGTFYNIPARAFYNTQCDLEYRKQWDRLVIKLDVIDKDGSSGCEVVQWVMHFPYPMYSREYVYLRKATVDHDRKVMYLMSHAVEHPSCPVKPEYVRVKMYKSNMVIMPHTSFDENGFDYILTYCDDPQAAIPSPAYNWMASTGVPDFVDKAHAAAMKLQELRSPTRDQAEYNEDSEQMTM